MREDELTSCVEARDGLEAVRLARDLSPDLVILDYSMPIMDGLEAAREIHALLPVVPIMLFSLHDSLMETINLEGTGVSAAVPKAKVTTLLVSTVRSLLNLPHSSKRLIPSR